jgi:hypothetical protein
MLFGGAYSSMTGSGVLRRYIAAIVTLFESLSYFSPYIYKPEEWEIVEMGR